MTETDRALAPPCRPAGTAPAPGCTRYPHSALWTGASPQPRPPVQGYSGITRHRAYVSLDLCRHEDAAVPVAEHARHPVPAVALVVVGGGEAEQLGPHPVPELRPREGVDLHLHRHSVGGTPGGQAAQQVAGAN